MPQGPHVDCSSFFSGRRSVVECFASRDVVFDFFVGFRAYLPLPRPESSPTLKGLYHHFERTLPSPVSPYPSRHPLHSPQQSARRNIYETSCRNLTTFSIIPTIVSSPRTAPDRLGATARGPGSRAPARARRAGGGRLLRPHTRQRRRDGRRCGRSVDCGVCGDGCW